MSTNIKNSYCPNNQLSYEKLKYSYNEKNKLSIWEEFDPSFQNIGNNTIQFEINL